ncbi:MAG: hypothetical protein ACI4KF_12440 [Huintestinicola sp.]
MKKALLTIFILLSISFFSACGAKEEDKLPIPEKFYRNVDIGDTIDEVMASESGITFTDDADGSGVTKEHIYKKFNSNEAINIDGKTAYLSYLFVDDALAQIDYTIEVEYKISELQDKPTKKQFNEYTMYFTESYGMPSYTSSDEAISLESCSAAWSETSPQISIYALQTLVPESEFNLVSDKIIVTICRKNKE